MSMPLVRVQEAKKLGFSTIILPKVCLKTVGKVEGVKLIGVENIREAVDVL